jgi:hypothetical protein
MESLVQLTLPSSAAGPSSCFPPTLHARLLQRYVSPPIRHRNHRDPIAAMSDER